jgi:hypothetical protein
MIYHSYNKVLTTTTATIIILFLLQSNSLLGLYCELIPNFLPNIILLWEFKDFIEKYKKPADFSYSYIDKE